MSALRKLDGDFARADLAAARSLLAQLPQDDVLTRFSLEERVEELEAKVIALGDQIAVTTASAALFFGGRPVTGARGIESEFGGRIVVQFQDLVSKVWAEGAGGLGSRGIVPNKAQSTLHITNVVRGSFGFLLEEAPDATFFDTPLKEAVDAAQVLMEQLSAPDEAEFQKAAEDIDPRVLAAARDFFELLKINGATLRMVVDGGDASFGEASITRAVERASGTEVEDLSEQWEGQLSGTLPDSHQFEFNAGGEHGIIRGKVAREIPSADLLEMNRNWVGQPARARMTVRRVRQKGEVVRQSFTLLGLDASE